MMFYLAIWIVHVSLLLNNVDGNESIVADYSDRNKITYNSEHLKVVVSSEILIHLTSTNKKGNEPNLKGKLGVNLQPYLLEPSIDVHDGELKIDWGSELSLVVKQLENKRCHRILWRSRLESRLEDCYDYGNSNWFGGPEVKKQLWPVEQCVFKELPYVTQEFENIAISEPYWLNSKGAYIYVNSTTPLFINSNHKYNSICLIANDVSPYLKRTEKILDYHVCSFRNPRTAHKHAIRNFIGKPHGIPDKRMVQHPIWSTWVRYKTNVNETSVLEFAKNITSYGFNNSQIEVDDNWETCYGSTQFNTSRFTNMTHLSEQLKSLGFRITIWVHPFVNLNCPTHSMLKANGYFVENTHGSVNTIWWDGNASVIDVTKPYVVEWFKQIHNKLLKDYNIDGFKFDAGETSWLPQIPVLNCSADDHPKAFTAAYVDAISNFTSLTELRVAHRTQKYPMFVRMLDKDSRWTFSNGLPTLITTMLVMNIQGYPWVLPDMVGGNAYGSDVVDKEMFIRWLQANTFMPAIQFSIAPWDFDAETVEISRKFVELHYKYSDKIIELMEKTVRTGAPLNPPIWWIDPKNPAAHRVNSEYLLGEHILVAPVLQKGAIERDVYLPKGCWKDGNHPNAIYAGRQLLQSYAADITILPYFIRIPCSSNKK